MTLGLVAVEHRNPGVQKKAAALAGILNILLILEGAAFWSW
jgi:hypothetical protein